MTRYPQKNRKQVVFEGLGVALALRVAVWVALARAEPVLEAVCVAEGLRDGLAEAETLEVRAAPLVSAPVDWPAAAAPAGEDEAAGSMVAAEPLSGPFPPLNPAMPTAATATAAAPLNIRACRRFFERGTRPGEWPDPARDGPERRPWRREPGAPESSGGSGSHTALMAGP